MTIKVEKAVRTQEEEDLVESSTVVMMMHLMMEVGIYATTSALRSSAMR